jgi:uncharacterized protein (DUF302 family)
MLLRLTVPALAVSLIAAFSIPAPATVPGLVTKASPHSVDATIERFEAAVKAKSFLVFARLDHAAGAAAVGLQMPRATVILFGNPRFGTPVMIKTPTIAIDLPLKAVVWEDSAGKVFLSYNSARYLFGTIYPRHGVTADAAIENRIETLLAEVAEEAVK